MDRLALLERTIPFQFLGLERLRSVARQMAERRFGDGDVLVARGDATRDFFLLVEGLVEAVDDLGQVRALVAPGQYFGEQAPLFERPRARTLRARGPVTTLVLEGDAFLALVEAEPAFALALASALRGKHGIFSRYRHLYARMLGLLDRRAFLLSDLLDAYEALSPALHPLLAEPIIDVGALRYALARLPADVTTTTFYYLCSALPEVYRDPDRQFDAVTTPARRRAIWQVMPGKLLVLLRDGATDVVDLVSCLCLYAVEARKIRRRLRSAQLIADLREAPPEAAPAILARLPLSDAERAGLVAIWGRDVLRQLRNVLLHHEDIGIECDLVATDYNASASERWVSQIRAEVAELVDLDDPDLEVHVISSNTHSVANCLSPYLGRRTAEIEAWGASRGESVRGLEVARDRLYVLAREQEGQDPAIRPVRIAEERAGGHHRLTSTAFTGIAVDLVDLGRIDPDLADPAVGARRASRPTLLVNVDYAFGQQAEEILANLCFLFDRRLRSLSVLGKAGGMVGGRGDVLLPSALILQTNDELYRLEQDLPAELLGELLPGRPIHRGRVLTVSGTLLQDRTLLWFYRRMYGCVGLEMEGSFFARQLQSAKEMGVVREDVLTRYAYYTSDLPLHPEDNLSAGMAAAEGVPPLYAITRAVLRRIFDTVR